MKSATVGWSFYMFLINFSQQDALVWVQHLTWPSHDRFDLWGTALKSSLLSGETSSSNEIKHLSSLKSLSQSGCPFNIISSEWPMLIAAVYFYTYVSHTCHSLKSAAQHRDVLIAMGTISIYYTSFDKESPPGKDKTVPMHAQTDQVYSCSNSSEYVSPSVNNTALLLKYAASAHAFLFSK